MYELARVNMRKSKALALGSWVKSVPFIGIPCCKELKVLGFHMHRSTPATAYRCWALISAKLQAYAQAAYHRAMSMDIRIRYIHDYLLSQLWYVAQIFPPNRCHNAPNKYGSYDMVTYSEYHYQLYTGRKDMGDGV
jgi:hypothetical protein